MAEIQLTRGFVAVVDDEDYEWLSAYNWFALNSKTHSTVYAYCWQPYPKQLLMHRVIMAAEKGQEVHHLNTNGLDNRKENLTLGTVSDNQLRRKNVKGYHYEPSRGKWKAMIMRNGKAFYLGRFDTEPEARAAYEDAKREILSG